MCLIALISIHCDGYATVKLLVEVIVSVVMGRACVTCMRVVLDVSKLYVHVV